MLERLAAAFAIAGGTILLVIAGLTGIDVLLHAADLVAPGRLGIVKGYEDLVRLLVSAAVPMLFPWCEQRRGHVAVDLLIDRLPGVARRWAEAAGVSITAAVALFLAFWMVHGLAESRADGRIAGVLGWPEWPFYAPGLVSLLLWAAIAIARLGPGRRS